MTVHCKIDLCILSDGHDGPHQVEASTPQGEFLGPIGLSSDEIAVFLQVAFDSARAQIDELRRDAEAMANRSTCFDPVKRCIQCNALPDDWGSLIHLPDCLAMKYQAKATP